MSRENVALTLLLAAYAVWKVVQRVVARRRVAVLRASGARIVDVRSAAEFAAAHAHGSVNIPLSDLGARLGELDPQRWNVLCCASGGRSAMAARRLRRAGFKQVYNAGSWRNCHGE